MLLFILLITFVNRKNILPLLQFLSLGICMTFTDHITDLNIDGAGETIKDTAIRFQLYEVLELQISAAGNEAKTPDNDDGQEVEFKPQISSLGFSPGTSGQNNSWRCIL